MRSETQEIREGYVLLALGRPRGNMLAIQLIAMGGGAALAGDARGGADAGGREPHPRGHLPVPPVAGRPRKPRGAHRPRHRPPPSGSGGADGSLARGDGGPSTAGGL